MKQTEEQEVQGNPFVIMLISLVLFYAIYFCAYQVSSSITTEKTSKIIETLVTSTTPRTIVLGKTIGIGIVGILVLLYVSNYFQYNATFFSTYIESGKRRISLAERLRKLPLSFFGKRDLSDLTSVLLTDCERIEHNFSHIMPQFYGSIISTCIIAISLFFFDWRMALAALWVLPIALIIVGTSGKVQNIFTRKKNKNTDKFIVKRRK